MCLPYLRSSRLTFLPSLAPSLPPSLPPSFPLLPSVSAASALPPAQTPTMVRSVLFCAGLVLLVAAQEPAANSSAPTLRLRSTNGTAAISTVQQALNQTASNATTALNQTASNVTTALNQTIAAANSSVTAALNATHLANVSVEISAFDKLLGDFFASGEAGLTPRNFRPSGGNRFSLTVRPYEEAVRITSPRSYTGGKFEFRCKTASVMPGIITAVYMASGHGRTSDTAQGQQDEIDLEWKGNTPNEVQSNVFIAGKDASQVTKLGFDSSSTETDYAIEWNDYEVLFYVNGNVARRVALYRPLKPMQLQLAVWTTIGGWPGLVQWAGSPDWSHSDSKQATATFEVLSVPQEE